MVDYTALSRHFHLEQFSHSDWEPVAAMTRRNPATSRWVSSTFLWAT